MSEGLQRAKRMSVCDHIKALGPVEKIELVQPFRKKYAWYFKQREQEAER